MFVTILSSGSSGNCILVQSDKTNILIDAGLTASAIKGKLSRCGIGYHLDAIFMTHEHVDHSRGARITSDYYNCQVYGTPGTLDTWKESGGCRCVKIDPDDSKININEEMMISPFRISHDSAEACGYTIRHEDAKITCCFDTGAITHGMLENLKGSDLLILEANHDPTMLEEGPYPEFLKSRVRSRVGHLSNEAAGHCLKHLKKEIGDVILAHLSKTNNTSELAKQSVENIINMPVKTASDVLMEKIKI